MGKVLSKIYYIIAFVMLSSISFAMESDTPEQIALNKKNYVKLRQILDQFPHAKKMGIELEIQGVNYANQNNIILVDHLRLFESHKKTPEGKPLWYLEVDGNSNIEFVSEAIDLKNANFLSVVLHDMNQVVHHMLNNSKIVYVGEEEDKKPVYEFSAEFYKEIQGIGKWVKDIRYPELEKAQSHKIIISDPLFIVKPQATFQFPIELFPRFANYMSRSHEKLKNKISILQDTKQLLFPDILPGKGEALAAFVELYIETFKDKFPKHEIGPKGNITLMSRIAFSDMYKALIGEEKQNFDTIIASSNYQNTLLFSGGVYPLFYPYNIMEEKTNDNNPQLFTQYQKENEWIKKLRTSLTYLKVNDWVKSIINPSMYNDAKKQNSELLGMSLGALKNILDYGLVNLELHNIKGNLFIKNDTDLMSPPPFLRDNYSMGKYSLPENYKEYGEAIIEMRGYSAKYPYLTMGKAIEYWLNAEIIGAINNWSSYSFKDGQYKKAINLINDLNIKDSISILNKIQYIEANNNVIKCHKELIKYNTVQIKMLLETLEKINNDLFKKQNDTINAAIQLLKKEKLEEQDYQGIADYLKIIYNILQQGFGGLKVEDELILKKQFFIDTLYQN